MEPKPSLRSELRFHLAFPVAATLLLGARSIAQLEDNLSSLDVTLTDKDLTRLDEVSTPSLNFPHDFLRDIAIDRQQAGTTVNGVPSKLYRIK